MRTKGYWATTAILVLGLVAGGMAELLRFRPTVEGILHLGYPLYFLTIIASWKVLAGIALVVPRFPRLKEWAYAGVFFNMTGAAISHAVCGDSAWHVVVTFTFALLAVVSWGLRPQSRTLGVLFPKYEAESASRHAAAAVVH